MGSSPYGLFVLQHALVDGFVNKRGFIQTAINQSAVFLRVQKTDRDLMVHGGTVLDSENELTRARDRVIKTIEEADHRLGKHRLEVPPIPEQGREAIRRRIPLVLRIGAVVVLVFIIAYVLVMLFRIGPQDPVRTAPPTVVITPTSISLPLDVWASFPKLTQAEARALRDQSNVVNVALLDGSAIYLKDLGVRFNSEDPGSWTNVNTSTMLSALTVQGTEVVVTVHGETYNLNLYQGFALKGGTEVFIVDHDGNVWSTQFTDALLVTIDEIVPDLPVAIAPNRQLTLTY